LKTKKPLKAVAIRTINDETAAITNLKKSVDGGFLQSVGLILRSTGRVIVTGIGKSAIIGQKIVATLNSTGTPAGFIHAADAIHGDVGAIQKGDVVICISNSGETPEIRILVPLLKKYGSSLIAMTGNRDSFLARQADLVINTAVEKEACPNNLAPTSSTTAQMVMGDALAIALHECRGFTAADFAKLHPGGALGKKLYLKVSDLYINNEVPKVDIEEDIRPIIVEISSKRLGAAAVLDNGTLAGIITDGDLRRMLQKFDDINGIKARDIMTRNPKTVDADMMVVDALDLMRGNNITQLPVLKNGQYVGVIHLHDILKEGIL
jgi:arabinose-5-phosphate isomerase